MQPQLLKLIDEGGSDGQTQSYHKANSILPSTTIKANLFPDEEMCRRKKKEHLTTMIVLLVKFSCLA